MANIPIEKKNSGAAWLWWLLGALLIGALIWLLAGAFGDDEPEFADTEVVTPAPMPEPEAEPAELTIATILANPAEYVGETFEPERVSVESVPTDRGFWITSGGARLFVILIDNPAEEPLDINPGQTLRIDEGVLRDQAYLSDLAGEPIDADTQNIVQEEPIFLVANETEITILEGGTPQPGTDPAQSVQ